jgi:hypothetical protein
MIVSLMARFAALYFVQQNIPPASRAHAIWMK